MSNFWRTSKAKEAQFGRPAADGERMELGSSTRKFGNARGGKEAIRDQRLLAILPALEKYLKARAKGTAQRAVRVLMQAPCPVK
jgi:hypothetical protein